MFSCLPAHQGSSWTRALQTLPGSALPSKHPVGAPPCSSPWGQTQTRLPDKPGSGLRALHPWLGQLGGQEHLLLILPAVQLVGYVLGGHPLDIFGVDGGPVLKQEAYTFRMAHECSYVQGGPAHGGAAETAGSCKIRKLPEGGTSRKRSMEGLRL